MAGGQLQRAQPSRHDGDQLRSSPTTQFPGHGGAQHHQRPSRRRREHRQRRGGMAEQHVGQPVQPRNKRRRCPHSRMPDGNPRTIVELITMQAVQRGSGQLKRHLEHRQDRQRPPQRGQTGRCPLPRLDLQVHYRRGHRPRHLTTPGAMPRPVPSTGDTQDLRPGPRERLPTPASICPALTSGKSTITRLDDPKNAALHSMQRDAVVSWPTACAAPCSQMRDKSRLDRWLVNEAVKGNASGLDGVAVAHRLAACTQAIAVRRRIALPAHGDRPRPSRSVRGRLVREILAERRSGGQPRWPPPLASIPAEGAPLAWGAYRKGSIQPARRPASVG